MHHRNTTFVSCFAVALLMSCFVAASAQAQTLKQSEDRQTLQSLLNEVRLLRQALQQTGLNAYRSQIIVERIKAQRDQVSRLTSLLSSARNEIDGIERTIPRMTDQAKMLESMAEREIDANKRAQMEFEGKERKLDVERYKKRLDQQRDLEKDLAAQMTSEQTKLNELESRLDALEREIENEVQRQRTEDAARDEKSRP